MYEYNIKGDEYVVTKAKQISRTVAVLVPKEWEDSDVVVIRAGEIQKFEKVRNE